MKLLVKTVPKATKTWRKKDPLNKGAIYLVKTEADRGLFPGS